MRLIIIADHDPLTAVEFNGAPLTWTPKVSLEVVKVVYRPGLGGAVVHVRTNGK